MFLASVAILFVLCLLAYDKMLPKFSSNLYRRLKIQSSDPGHKTVLTPLYLLALSIHSNVTAAFALSLGVLFCSIFCIITLVVSKYMAPSMRFPILSALDPRKLFVILSSSHRDLHISMGCVLICIVVFGTMVFIKDTDCSSNEEESLAKIQYQVLFTNINAAFMSLIVLWIYAIMNINTT